MSPFEAKAMLHGSVSAAGGSPATPGLPITASSFPSGENLNTAWPAGLAFGYFAFSRGFIERMSTTHTLPSRSCAILCGNTKRPAPKLFTMAPSGLILCTGAQSDPAQVSYRNADSPGGTSGFAPQRSATQSETPSLSTATAFSAPQAWPSGSLPQGAIVLYGLGRSFVGVASRLETRPGLAQPMSAARTTIVSLRMAPPGANGSAPRRPAAYPFLPTTPNSAATCFSLRSWRWGC